jgi:hypothetical protein
MQWGDLSSIIAGLGVKDEVGVLADILENVLSH